VARGIEEGRKRFFFEKKKQKTFGPAGFDEGGARAPRSKSFFASFFSKKRSSYFHFAPLGLPEITLRKAGGRHAPPGPGRK
jgi:hypothetical protein